MLRKLGFCKTDINMYLKTLEIRNFRGIENLKVKFHENINVIIGPNGVCKTAVIDAIRLFFQLGDIDSENRLPIREEDFHRKETEDVRVILYLRD